MKRIILSFLLLFTLFECSFNGTDHNIINVDEKKISPPDLPKEFMAVQKEYEKIYNEAQTDPSKNTQLSQITEKLCAVASKYDIKIYSDEEFKNLYPESADYNLTRTTYSLAAWLNSIWGYYSSGRAYVNWDPYYDADYYDVWRKSGSQWIYWVELIGEASGFVDSSTTLTYYIRCTSNDGTSAGKNIYL